MNSGINPENTAVWRKNEVDMPTTSFKGYNIVEFSFANKLPPGAQIQLENKYQFNVKYASNKTCVGEMSIRVADRSNAESFFVSLLLRGVFTFTPGTAKEEIHIETYKTLFPTRAPISQRLPPRRYPADYYPEVDIESQSIYRFDIKPKIVKSYAGLRSCYRLCPRTPQRNKGVGIANILASSTFCSSPPESTAPSSSNSRVNMVKISF